MKKSAMFLLSAVLLLGGCAQYTPNMSDIEKAKPKYADDLTTCQHRQKEIAGRFKTGFGLAGVLYAYATLTPEEIKESEEANTPDGIKKIIDKCMKEKGYKVKP